MSWILFSILAAIVWAIVNVIDKYILSKLVSKPIVPVMILGVIGLVASLVVFSTKGFGQLSPINSLLALVAGILFVLMTFFYFRAVKVEDVSKVIPLFCLSPLFILFIAGFFLGETFTATKYFGILLLVAGAILISLKNLTSFSFGKAFWLMVLSSLSLAVSQVITKYLLNFYDFWTVFAYIRIGAFVALIPVFWLNFSDLKNLYRESRFKTFGLISVNESLNLLGVIFITLASAIGFVTLVNALSSIQPFFVLLFSVLLSIFYPQILKEEIMKSKLFLKFVSIVIMFIGAVLIS